MTLLLGLNSQGMIELPHQRIAGALDLGQYTTNFVLGFDLLYVEWIEEGLDPIHTARVGCLGNVEEIPRILFLKAQYRLPDLGRAGPLGLWRGQWFELDGVVILQRKFLNCTVKTVMLRM